MSGTESTADIDKIATITALSSTKIPPEQKNKLRELLCGCVGPQKRQSDCQRAVSPMCLFCVGETEDEDHMLWRCPQWEALRCERQAPSRHGRLL